MASFRKFEAGSLWPSVCETTRRAAEEGSLLPIPTDLHVVDRDGRPFLVRIVSHFARKPRPAPELPENAGRNPFLPYEETLYVSDASPTHVCLLNKFMVVDHHLLIVTREFVHQQTALDRGDFLRSASAWANTSRWDSTTRARWPEPVSPISTCN